MCWQILAQKHFRFGFILIVLWLNVGQKILKDDEIKLNSYILSICFTP